MTERTDFWVTNVSKCNVSLRDLALTIKARTSVNLLDKKHYSYTLEQLETSAASGSIFTKNASIKIRNVPPAPIESPALIVLSPAIRSGKRHNIVEVTAPRYEELDDSDEKFAEESVNIALEPYDE